jgi:hypothetical protein
MKTSPSSPKAIANPIRSQHLPSIGNYPIWARQVEDLLTIDRPRPKMRDLVKGVNALKSRRHANLNFVAKCK